MSHRHSTGAAARHAAPCRTVLCHILLRRIALCLTAVGLAAAVLSGCGALGGAPHERDDQWVQDASSGRWFQASSLRDGPDAVAEHLPALQTVAGVSLIDGQFSDPHERVTIPGPDDYWWQAVVELDPAEASQLAVAAQDAAADSSGAEPDLYEDAELLAAIVAPLAEEVSPCPGGWISVAPVLSEPGHQNLTAAGDGLDVLAVCLGGDQLIVSAYDM